MVFHLELDVSGTGVGAPRAEDLQGYVAIAICDLKPVEDISTTIGTPKKNNTKATRPTTLKSEEELTWA